MYGPPRDQNAIVVVFVWFCLQIVDDAARLLRPSSTCHGISDCLSAFHMIANLIKPDRQLQSNLYVEGGAPSHSSPRHKIFAKSGRRRRRSPWFCQLQLSLAIRLRARSDTSGVGGFLLLSKFRNVDTSARLFCCFWFCNNDICLRQNKLFSLPLSLSWRLG